MVETGPSHSGGFTHVSPYNSTPSGEEDGYGQVNVAAVAVAFPRLAFCKCTANTRKQEVLVLVKMWNSKNL